MQNKPNFRNVEMNLNPSMTMAYKNNSHLLTMGKQTQSNPTCRGVASGEAGSNPTCSELACPELACGELVEPVEGVEPISKGQAHRIAPAG